MNEKISRRVALIFGGCGCEHDVSVLGAINVESALKEAGIKSVPILIKRGGGWFASADPEASAVTLTNESAELFSVFPTRLDGKAGFISRGGFFEVDVALPLLHGDCGEDGRIQGLLETVGIPFIGCDTTCGALSSDKAYTKLIAKSIGIPTVSGISLSPGDSLDTAICTAESELGYPIFVKPTRLGSSIGASAAGCRDELRRALDTATAIGRGYVLAEKYISGARELECAFFECYGKQYFTNIGEIRCEGGFYDFNTKYSESSTAHLTASASLPQEIRDTVREYAKRIVHALGCRHLSRIDFFLADGVIYFNEINTMPGMTRSSMFPRLVEGEGISLSEFLSDLVESTARAPE